MHAGAALKKTVNTQTYAHPIGTIVKTKVWSPGIGNVGIIINEHVGLVIGMCPNPWYSKVQLDNGQVLDIFSSDLAKVEEG